LGSACVWTTRHKPSRPWRRRRSKHRRVTSSRNRTWPSLWELPCPVLVSRPRRPTTWQQSRI